MAKFDTYQEITDAIIEAMEAGTPPWRSPWTGGSCGGFPTRANGEFYNGINVLILWLTAEKKGFRSPYWMTFKQAKALGGAVRKGEKSTRVIYYGTLERDGDEGEDKETIPYIKTYAAFNADQIDELPEAFIYRDTEDMGTVLHVDVMANFHRAGVPIKDSDTQSAAYLTETDEIEMPFAHTFFDEQGYYAVLAHELVHATGHKSRLDRFSEKTPYAFEELVAEIGNCMVCARLGLTPQTERAAAYLDHWLGVLKEDKKAIFKAASQAQKACDFLIERIVPTERKECA